MLIKKPIGSVPSYRAQCTLPPRLVCQTSFEGLVPRLVMTVTVLYVANIQHNLCHPPFITRDDNVQLVQNVSEQVVFLTCSYFKKTNAS